MGNELQAQSGPWIAPQCNLQCPLHCSGHGEEAERLIKLQGDLAARNRSLSLSVCLIVIVLGAQILFAYNGKTLNIPNIEYLYALMSAPWFGIAGDKITQLIIQKKAEGSP